MRGAAGVTRWTRSAAVSRPNDRPAVQTPKRVGRARDLRPYLSAVTEREPPADRPEDAKPEFGGFEEAIDRLLAAKACTSDIASMLK